MLYGSMVALIWLGVAFAILFGCAFVGIKSVMRSLGPDRESKEDK